MGNIGQHYYDWRYGFFGQPGPGTGTPYATPAGVITPTYAPTLTPGAGTPQPSTSAVPSTTAVPSGTVSPSPTNTIGPTGGTPLPTNTATTVPSGFNTPTPSP